METLNVRLRMPALARLLLTELADRRGQPDHVLLADLILREAVGELGTLVQSGTEAPESEGSSHG